MKHINCLAVVLLCGVLPLGCQRSGGPDRSEQSASPFHDDAHADRATDGERPDAEQAVTEFLEALRRGDEAKASRLLTTKARRETAKSELALKPEGSQSATFTVDKVEYVTSDGAEVTATWTDTNRHGQTQSNQIVWILRNESQGWRIAGMGVEVFEGQPPAIFNFEDPASVINESKRVNEELARRDRLPAQADNADKPAANESITK